MRPLQALRSPILDAILSVQGLLLGPHASPHRESSAARHCRCGVASARSIATDEWYCLGGVAALARWRPLKSLLSRERACRTSPVFNGQLAAVPWFSTWTQSLPSLHTAPKCSVRWTCCSGPESLLKVCSANLLGVAKIRLLVAHKSGVVSRTGRRRSALRRVTVP